jgi:putative aldouronate transport system substrate-binding protein
MKKALRILLVNVCYLFQWLFQLLPVGKKQKHQKQQKDSTTSESTSEATTTATTTETEEVAVKEPITLTVFGGETEKTFLKGVQEDPVMKNVADSLGITIDIIGQSTDPEVAKIMVASGDLPDVVQLNKELMTTLIQNGQLIELDGLLETHGQDIVKNAKLAVNYSKNFLSNGEEKVYAIPSQIDASGKVLNLVAPYIRWDYYAELGYPEVNSYDQLLEVVAQMLEKHPTNENGEKNYGFSMWFDWDTFAFGMLPGYQSGIQPIDPGLGWDMFNRKVVDWVDNDDSFMWEGVRFWNKANQMGLLDPDALTQKYDQAIEKGGQNRILCEVTQWQQGNTNNNLRSSWFCG